MVGRRSLSQRRVVEDRCESRSPDPRHPVMFRGSPSLPSTFHRRPAPSPGTQARRLYSPSPMLRSSAHPDDVSSSEEGDPSEVAVMSSDEEEHPDDEGSRVNLSTVGDLSPIVEEVEIRLVCDREEDRLVSSPVTTLSSILEEESSMAEDLASSSEIRPPCCVSTKVQPSSMAETLSMQILHGRDRVASLSSTVAHMAVGSGLRKMMGDELTQISVATAALGGQKSLVRGSSQLPVASVYFCPSSCVPATVADAMVGGGEVNADMQVTGRLGSVTAEAGVPTDAPSVVPTDAPLLPMSCGIVGMGDGGVVREEARVSPVAREALRSQPTDGLRQPPSSPAVPVSEVVLLGLLFLLFCFLWISARRGLKPSELLDEGGSLAPPVWPRRRPSLEGDVLTQPRRHRSLVDECRRHLQVAHPRLMWSYDSPRNREIRVRTVVERSLREGMGSEEEDSRPVLSDFAVTVAPVVDLAPPGDLEPDLRASLDGPSLTMAENLHDQSLVLLDARGCEVMQGPSMGSVVLSDGDGSEMMEADLSEIRVVASVISGAPARGFVDGEEVQESDAGPDAALSPPCSLVSVPSSPRCEGLLVAVDEDRGCADVKGPSPAVIALSDASGGQAIGDRLTGLNLGGLGSNITAVTDGIFSVNPVTSLSIVCPSSRPDSVDFAVPLLSNVDGTMIEGGMVSEEGLASLAARAALRPSPTDGRRQPPLSPVEPAMVPLSGGLMPGGGQASRSYAHCGSAVGLPTDCGSSVGSQGGGLAPPTSPGRQISLKRSRLTHPRRPRSLVEDCRRALRAVNPALVYYYESERHREFRVREVVERVLMEGLSSTLVELRPELISVEGERDSIVASRPGPASSIEEPRSICGSPSWLDLGTICEGTASIDEVVLNEELISMGEQMASSFLVGTTSNLEVVGGPPENEADEVMVGGDVLDEAKGFKEILPDLSSAPEEFSSAIPEMDVVLAGERDVGLVDGDNARSFSPVSGDTRIDDGGLRVVNGARRSDWDTNGGIGPGLGSLKLVEADRVEERNLGPGAGGASTCLQCAAAEDRGSGAMMGISSAGSASSDFDGVQVKGDVVAGEILSYVGWFISPVPVSSSPPSLHVDEFNIASGGLEREEGMVSPGAGEAMMGCGSLPCRR
ncbi:hypothetical protein Dimus_003411 [Dionaea muscipula]